MKIHRRVAQPATTNGWLVNQSAKRRSVTVPICTARRNKTTMPPIFIVLVLGTSGTLRCGRANQSLSLTFDANVNLIVGQASPNKYIYTPWRLSWTFQPTLQLSFLSLIWVGGEGIMLQINQFVKAGFKFWVSLKTVLMALFLTEKPTENDKVLNSLFTSMWVHLTLKQYNWE